MRLISTASLCLLVFSSTTRKVARALATVVVSEISGADMVDGQPMDQVNVARFLR